MKELGKEETPAVDHVGEVERFEEARRRLPVETSETHGHHVICLHSLTILVLVLSRVYMFTVQLVLVCICGLPTQTLVLTYV